MGVRSAEANLELFALEAEHGEVLPGVALDLPGGSRFLLGRTEDPEPLPPGHLRAASRGYDAWLVATLLIPVVFPFR